MGFVVTPPAAAAISPRVGAGTPAAIAAARAAELAEVQAIVEYEEREQRRRQRRGVPGGPLPRSLSLAAIGLAMGFAPPELPWP